MRKKIMEHSSDPIGSNSSYSIAARISLGLAFLTLSALFLSYLLGMLPDSYQATQKGRHALAEAMALSASLAAQRNDAAAMKYILTSLTQRNPEVLSAGLRTRDGKLFAEAGDHDKQWRTDKVGDASLTEVKFSIYEGDKLWGDLELRFSPIGDTPSYIQFLGSNIDLSAYSIIRAIVFVGVIGFIAYVFYIRKVLRYLDPSAVIPERVQKMLNTLSEGVIILDNAGHILLANGSFSVSLGVPAPKLLGIHASRFGWRVLEQDTSPAAKNSRERYPWEKVLSDDMPQHGVALRLPAINGPARTFNVNATPIAGHDGRTRGVMVTFDDMTTLEHKNRRLRKMLGLLKKSQYAIRQQNVQLQILATRDPLTGCLNRRAFFEVFDTAWSTAERHQQALSVMMVDIDHFKSVNDKYGHARGDDVLKGVAEVLKAACRSGDHVGRYGGEEFCVLLPLSSTEESLLTAERYRQAVAATPIADITVTISIGVSTLGLGALNPHQLIQQADRALYAAKEGGRNRATHWTQLRVTLDPHPTV